MLMFFQVTGGALGFLMLILPCAAALRNDPCKIQGSGPSSIGISTQIKIEPIIVAFEKHYENWGNEMSDGSFESPGMEYSVLKRHSRISRRDSPYFKKRWRLILQCPLKWAS